MKHYVSKSLRIFTGAGCLAFGLVAAVADYPSTVSSLNPVGYWRLNEPTQPVVPTYPINNSSAAGATLNGLYYGVPALGGPGAVAGDAAASLSGNLQFAEVPSNAALNPTGPFTVEFWANVTNDTAGAKSGVVSRYITVAGGPNAQLGYLFFLNNGNTTWQFRVYNGTAATTITDLSTVDVAANTWYHVAGVYDGANIHVYVNGVPTSTSTGTVVYQPNTNAPTRIGAGTPETAPSLFFPGMLDNVAVFHSALSAAQIAAHYEAATTNAAGYNAQILADNPAAYYRMYEAALPPYVPYMATNSGSLGAAQNGTYSLAGATSGLAGPLRGQFAGFSADNKSAGLNGTSGQIDIPGFATTTDTATFVGWIKRNGTIVNASPILSQRASGSPNSGLVVDFNNRVGYVWNDSAATYNFNPGADFFIPDGIWTFAAVSVTSSNATIYIGSTNGLKSVTHANANAPHDFSGGPLQIGRDGTSGTRYIKGNVDEVALFDQALDFTAVSNLFYSATPAVPLVTRIPAEPAAIYEGMTVSFTAYGLASGPINYQWRRNGANLGGQTTATLNLVNVNTGNSGNYDVVVTSGANSVTSSVSAITVVAGPPVVFTNPVSITRFTGAQAVFTVAAGGSVPLTYQWQKNSNDIAGATSPTLTLNNVSASDAAFYRVKLVNPYGTNFTANGTLSLVNEANPFPTLAIADGPMAYWRLNETSGTTAFDYAGSFNGTTVGAVTLGSVGPRPASGQNGFETGNTAFTLDGANTWVEAPALNWNTNTMTFAAWIKVAAYHPSDLAGVLFSRGANANGIHMLSSGELRYHWNNDKYGFSSGIIVPIDQWVFVALVVEPTKATLYLNDGNGLVSAVNNSTHVVVSGSDPMFLGRDQTGRVFNGAIDEALVFKRALSASEIQNLNLVGFSGPTAPQLIAAPAPQAVLVGQSASFSVGVLGSAPLTYQWKRNGTDIPGATSSTLNLANVYYTQAGSYTCGITNSLGGIISPAAALTVSPYPQFANLTNELVLHLKFDGTVSDSSGRNNHGTIVGATTYAGGKLGSALHYNTDTANSIYNYVTLGNPTDFEFSTTTDFSVAYWVKFTGNPGDLPFLCSAINSYGNFGLTFAPSYNGGGWSYYLGGSSGGASSIGLYGPDNSINNGAWHSLVHTFDRDGNAVTYLDGVAVDTRAMSVVDTVDSGSAFTIGQDPTGVYPETGAADIDDVGIWRRALTPVEAQSIYLAAQNGTTFDTYGPVRLTLQKSGANLEIIWQAGTLQWADDVAGPYTNVPGAAAPYYTVTPSLAKKFYRVQL